MPQNGPILAIFELLTPPNQLHLGYSRAPSEYKWYLDQKVDICSKFDLFWPFLNENKRHTALIAQYLRFPHINFWHMGHVFTACGGLIGLKFAPDLYFMNIWNLAEDFLKIFIFATMAAIFNP